MHANPSTLDTTTLVSCLVASAGEERDRQVDFLLYLAEFDAREAFREKACDSLWEFCRRELRLRSGAAGRRIGVHRAEARFGRRYMLRCRKRRPDRDGQGTLASDSDSE